MASSMLSLRRYAVPLILFTAGLFFQLVVLPSSFPTSHYDVLGVRRAAPVSEVEEAYQKLESRWSSGSYLPTIDEFIKIRYAFELLSNPIWKRDYDNFGIDENMHAIEKVKKNYSGDIYSKIKLPMLDAPTSEFEGDSYKKFTNMSFISGKACLIQVYSSGSLQSAGFSDSWNRIVNYLDGVVDTGVVELGEHNIASLFAERRYTGQTFFRNGLPALIAFSPNCRSLDCCMRYAGDLSKDLIVDWMATTILGLPRIFYYSKETLDQQFLAKSGRHKVKVIFFSKTGQRALPFLRKAAKDYQAYTSFASVWWQDDDSSFWFNRFQVESAPAIVFLKDPGVKPVVYHGMWNSSSFTSIIEQNKYHDLPQLRSITSMELGCDARGNSRAGHDTTAWYCVIVAGRPSLRLNIMREMMRNVQKELAEHGNQDHDNDDSSPQGPAAQALKNNRLTLAWLDGELQNKYCSFYLHSETSYETCGSRRFADIDDVPQLFLVRYRRNSTEDQPKVEKRMKGIWDTLDEDANLASQLVARYNGSEDVPEIIQWISQMINDGDTRKLPYFRAQTPELVPEDADAVLSKRIQGVLNKGGGLKKKLQGITASIYDGLTDPRLGPILLLGACISFGATFIRSQSDSQDKKVEGNRTRKRTRRAASQNDPPFSITDTEPKGARQILLSDSDSE